MFEVPESDIVCVRIDEEVIMGKKPVEFIRQEKPAVPSSANAADLDAEKTSNDTLDGEQKSKAKTYA
jgi:hypothetical protein